MSLAGVPSEPSSSIEKSKPSKRKVVSVSSQREKSATRKLQTRSFLTDPRCSVTSVTLQVTRTALKETK